MSFKEIKKYIWSYHPEFPIVIPTNGIIKSNGCAVMGKGLALEASNRFPTLASSLGYDLAKSGNHVYIYFLCTGEELDSGKPFARDIITFPVKYDWRDKADLNLIEQSCKELIQVLKRCRRSKILLPRVGCGNGQLDWDKVKPVLERYFDDRFVIVEKNS